MRLQQFILDDLGCCLWDGYAGLVRMHVEVRVHAVDVLLLEEGLA